jgi:transcription antitermination protein NusB
MKSRTKARSLALQVLYEFDLTGHQPGTVLQERLIDLPIDDKLAEFSRKIIYGVLELRDALDGYISKHAPEWPMDQVATIDRNILRIALWEFTFAPDTPVKVIINEAVELAKTYGSDSTPRFVNGVLGSLVENQNEIRQAFAAKLNHS